MEEEMFHQVCVESMRSLVSHSNSIGKNSNSLAESVRALQAHRAE